MTPKEKAKELAGKYWDLNYSWDGVTKNEWSKEGALIAVDEIIEAIEQLECKDSKYDYWVEIQQEIENI